MMKRRTLLGIMLGAPIVRAARPEARSHAEDIKPSKAPQPEVRVGGRRVDAAELRVNSWIGESWEAEDPETGIRMRSPRPQHDAKFRTLCFAQLGARCSICLDGQVVFDGNVSRRTLHRHPVAGTPIYYEVECDDWMLRNRMRVAR